MAVSSGNLKKTNFSEAARQAHIHQTVVWLARPGLPATFGFDRWPIDSSTSQLKIITTGIVKQFSGAKGFDFIIPDDSSEDLFTYFSAISSAGFKSLKESQKASFEAAQGPEGK